MSIQELINAAKNRTVSAQEIKIIQERLQEADRMFEEEAKLKSVNHDFLSKAYSL